MATDLIDLLIDASMEPSLCPNRRHKGRFIEIGCFRRDHISGDVTLFSICLLHHSKPAKLTLDAVEVTVVLLVPGYKPVAADTVVGFHSFNTMDRKWQVCDPRFALKFVLQIELRRWRVLHDSFRTKVVYCSVKQMRFL